MTKIPPWLSAAGLPVTVDVRWDFPLGEAVLNKVLRVKPWLVAKATSHHNVLQRTLLSNTDWFLIRNCPAPLWLVKPRSSGAPSSRPSGEAPTPAAHSTVTQLRAQVPDAAKVRSTRDRVSQFKKN